MDLIVNGEKTAEDPHHTQVRAAMGPLLSGAGHKVLLRRNDFDWVSVTWNRSAGLKLKCMKSRSSSDVLEDTTLFVSYRRAVALLCSYARGFDGWHQMVEWQPKGTTSTKSVVEQVIFVGSIVGAGVSLLSFPFAIAAYVKPNLLTFIDARPALAGSLLLLVGLTSSLWRLPDFAYRNEREDNQPSMSHHFLYGLYMSALGLILVLADAFG